MSTASDELAALKAKALALEAEIGSEVGKIASSDTFKSPKFWIFVGALVALMLLHYWKLDVVLIREVFVLAVVYLGLHTANEMVVNIMNGLIEVARAKAGKDDGAPAKPAV